MIKLQIEGQMKSGKNNMLMTRKGHKYPAPKWAEWRDRVVDQLICQYHDKAIDSPCSIVIHYTAGDKRRRDVPGMMDALWHCLEKALVVADDKYLADVKWVSFYEKNKARVTIYIGDGEIK